MRLVTPLAIPGSASPHCGGGSFYLLHSGSQLQHVPPICRVKWSGCCHGNTSTSLDRVGRGLAKIERTCLSSDSLATRGLEFSPCILCACVLLSPLPPPHLVPAHSLSSAHICSQVTQSYTHHMQTQPSQSLYLLCLVFPPCPSQIRKQIFILQNALITNSPFQNTWSLPMVALTSPRLFLPVKVLSLLPGLLSCPSSTKPFLTSFSTRSLAIHSSSLPSFYPACQCL